MNYVGSSVKRIEDRPLLTGITRFAADVSFPHQLHMRVVRSPVAHGRLISLDVTPALELPGVVGVWTAEDVAELPPINFRMTKVAGLEPYRQPVLARDRVRYVGEPMAVVFADDPYVAEDGADLVFAEIDELPPVVDATLPPALFDDQHDTEPALIQKSYGDIEAAFREAYDIVELRLEVGRQSGVPMETRGAVCRYDPMKGVVEMFGAAKVPHYNRTALAEMLGLRQDQVILREGHVGGGFGIRGELYPEDVLACLGALRLGSPVKWIEDRREHLVSANQSRDQVHQIRAAVDRDGWIRGVISQFWLSQGAYVRTHGATVSDLTAALLPGPYVWPAYQSTGHIRLTNKTPCGTYRAPGRFESTFVRERLMDVVADRLGLDAVAVRYRNLIPPESMPFQRGVDTLGTQVVYDSGDYPGLFDQLLEHLGYPGLRAELEQRRSQGETVGVGFGFFVEKSGLGPFDGAEVTVDETGQVTVITGAASIGQGIETTIAQICADALGAGLESVSVRHGQTDEISHGMGAFASRVTVMTGSAVHLAARQVRDKALATAAPQLEASVQDLVCQQGQIFVRGSPSGPSVSLGEVAQLLRPGPSVEEPGLSAQGWFEADHMTYPYGIHAAIVTVDRETGEVVVQRYVVAYDVGRAVNPQLVDGQIVGAAAQGIGGALLEEFCYDETGQPLAASFMDYLMPTLAEMPRVEVLLREDAPSPLNPLGVKGAGEGGITAAGAAIANAVVDALGNPMAVTRLPISPALLREQVGST